MIHTASVVLFPFFMPQHLLFEQVPLSLHNIFKTSVLDRIL